METWFNRIKVMNRQNFKLSVAIFFMIILICGSLFLKFRLISMNMPYSCHTDEKYIIEPALNILKTGDFNPHSFRYPSLPIYLAAMSFTIGYLQSASHLEISSTKDIEINVFPYFKHPRIILYGKVVFAFLSALAFVFLAIAAYRFYSNVFLLVGVPLVAILSNLYFYTSYNYLNVDTVATFFIFTVYMYQSFFLKKDTFFHKAVIPGILSGLVIASKYNMVWVIVPSILVIIFYAKKRRPTKILLLFLIMLLTFILVVPYSLLDFNTFLDWLAYDITIYKAGDANNSTSIGLPQLMYYLNTFFFDYGALLCFLSIFGILSSFFLSWKKSLILLSFPILLLVHMSTYSIHYPRNIMSLYGIFALFAAFGIVRSYELLCRYFNKLSLIRWPQGIKKGIVIIFLSVILLFLVKVKIRKQIITKPDSRNLAIFWITQRVEKKRNIIISKELGLFLEPIEQDYNIIEWEFETMDSQSFYDQVKGIENPIVIMPTFRPHYEHQLNAKEQADSMNKIGKSLKIKKTFGRFQAIINRPVHVIGKNPKILIGTL